MKIKRQLQRATAHAHHLRITTLVADIAGSKGGDYLFSFPPLSFLFPYSSLLSLSSCERFAATHAAHRYAFHSLDCSNKAFKVIIWCRFTLI